MNGFIYVMSMTKRYFSVRYISLHCWLVFGTFGSIVVDPSWLPDEGKQLSEERPHNHQSKGVELRVEFIDHL
jgi:hypothetical protein